MQNAGLEEAQTRIKIVRRNTNNLLHTDDSTLMAESEKELMSLLIKVKEESEKAGLKHNIQKTNIVASSPITSWQIDGEAIEKVRNHIPRILKLPGTLDLHSSVQMLSRVLLFATPGTAARQASLSLTISQRLPSSCPLNR